MSDPLYYYVADNRTVYRRPVKTSKSGGMTTISVGFPVCEVSEWVSDPSAVAELLNQADPPDVNEPA